MVPAFQRSTDGCCTKFPPAKVALRITEQELTDVGVSDEQAEYVYAFLNEIVFFPLFSVKSFSLGFS